MPLSLFDPAAIQSALSALPPHKNGAVIGTVDTNGARVVVVATRSHPSSGAEWTVEAVAQHAWDGENTVGGQVLVSW